MAFLQQSNAPVPSSHGCLDIDASNPPESDSPEPSNPTCAPSGELSVDLPMQPAMAMQIRTVLARI
jgi:hypothetical protein